MSQPKKDPNKKENYFKQSLPLIYLIVLLFALRWTIVEPYVVPTGSMEPTLKPGDRLYALKCAYDVRFPFTDWILLKTGTIKRGDVILFKNPKDPSITFVKRVVALPGDRLDYHDGKLFVNNKETGETLQKDREVMEDLEQKNDRTLFIENLDNVKHYMILENQAPEQRSFREMEYMPFRNVTVPENEFFAMGDNRDNSYDSRFWGFVPMNYLKGRAMFIWYSSWNWKPRPERIGTLIQ